jgi:MoaA/NifB/PqqE/SkfB family radical SAM enzyme
MAEVNNKVIKITVDTDKAKIKIEGVEGYFRKAETAAKALNKVLDQNTQKWGRTEAALS